MVPSVLQRLAFSNFAGLSANSLLALLRSAQAWSSFCVEPGWVTSWADDFNGVELDATTWTKDVRGPGNSRTRDAAAIADSVWVANGALTIRTDAAWDGARWRNLTSGAVQSRGRLSWRGRHRVCVAAKLPGSGRGRGDGIWPAHWLLPDNDACWPCNGELDIMEMINADGVLRGTYHWCLNGTCGSGPTHKHEGYTIKLPSDWPRAWHEYAVEFDGRDVVHWAIDGMVYGRVSGAARFFDVPYYVILNTAVGGPWPRPPHEDTVFPSLHLVDYVRVAEPARLVV